MDLSTDRSDKYQMTSFFLKCWTCTTHFFRSIGCFIGINLIYIKSNSLCLILVFSLWVLIFDFKVYWLFIGTSIDLESILFSFTIHITFFFHKVIVCYQNIIPKFFERNTHFLSEKKNKRNQTN